MAENKKTVLIISGFISVALCAAGFTSKAEEMQVQRVGQIEEIKLIETMENTAETLYIERINAEAIPFLRSGVEKGRQVAAEKAKEIEQEKQAAAETKSLLASIIFCEAGNQPYEGQVAVGAVVMNRVKNEQFPNTVEEVIYQSGQFTPACTGWLDQIRNAGEYTDSAMQAAEDALAGANPVGACLYFDRGGSGMQIGDHYFH